MVWGRSFCKAENRDASSAFSMKEKERFCRDLVTLPSSSSAAWGPYAFSSTVLAYSSPPSVTARLVRHSW